MYTRYIPKFWKVCVKMHTVLIEDIQLCINSNNFHLEGILKSGVGTFLRLPHWCKGTNITR